jgi:hypothetical protein
VCHSQPDGAAMRRCCTSGTLAPTFNKKQLYGTGGACRVTSAKLRVRQRASPCRGRADLAGLGFQGEGLLQEAGGHVDFSVPLERGFSLAGDEQYFHLRPIGCQLRCQLCSTHLGHDHVSSSDRWCRRMPPRGPGLRPHSLLPERYNRSKPLHLPPAAKFRSLADSLPRAGK